jgi:hypothetical protein
MVTVKSTIMKAIFILLLLLTITAHAFCQQTGRLNKPDNLQKSKHQKTAAWIMLGGGFALAAGGVAVDVSNWYSSGGDVMLIAGSASMLGSIPLFIASSRNKRKAMSASAFFKIERLPIMPCTAFSCHRYPAFSIRIDW